MTVRDGEAVLVDKERRADRGALGCSGLTDRYSASLYQHLERGVIYPLQWVTCRSWFGRGFVGDCWGSLSDHGGWGCWLGDRRWFDWWGSSADALDRFGNSTGRSNKSKGKEPSAKAG